MEILLSILSIIIGVIATWYFSLPDRTKRIKSLSKYKTKETNWICEWQETSNSKTWIKDKMILTKKFGTIFFTVVKQDKQKYYWEIKGKIVQNFLLGEYYSLRDGAHSSGSLSLKINPQGNSMVGFWCGTSNSVKLYRAKIILYKDDINVDDIKNNFNNYL